MRSCSKKEAFTPSYTNYSSSLSYCIIANKKGPIPKRVEPFLFAERQGFEPWVRARRTTVFETAPFDHSGISPSKKGDP